MSQPLMLYSPKVKYFKNKPNINTMYVGDFNVCPIKIQDKNNIKDRGAKFPVVRFPIMVGIV